MKSFFKFASLTFAIGILLAACSAEEPTVKPDPTPAQEKPNPYRKDLGDALKSADKMIPGVVLQDLMGTRIIMMRMSRVSIWGTIMV